jgi:signal peptidase I
MFSYFAPAYIKEARLILKNARKHLHYKEDVLSGATLSDLRGAMDRLEDAIKARDKAQVEAAAGDLDKKWSQHLPPASDAAWRENCEVFLVAIVIAVGVRSFFLQPFTIPTGSMQPTLNGIIGQPMLAEPPNVAMQAVDFILRGRNYINVTAKSDETVVSMTERKPFFFFTVTALRCTNNTYTIWAPADTLRRSFGVEDGAIPWLPASHYHAGQIIARGAVDAGDHVFVDKVSYNLHTPHRGTVFVFSTRNITRIQRGLEAQGIEGSEFYIKRLGGLPGDTLRIDSPLLYINGNEAPEFGFQRVMKKQGPFYRGYSNPTMAGPMDPTGALYLTSPTDTFTVPEHCYFALGDNSFNSSDSRYWGTVPEDNLMGRGLFVYWPFLPHWGFVK